MSEIAKAKKNISGNVLFVVDHALACIRYGSVLIPKNNILANGIGL